MSLTILDTIQNWKRELFTITIISLNFTKFLYNYFVKNHSPDKLLLISCKSPKKDSWVPKGHNFNNILKIKRYNKKLKLFRFKRFPPRNH